MYIDMNQVMWCIPRIYNLRIEVRGSLQCICPEPRLGLALAHLLHAHAYCNLHCGGGGGGGGIYACV